METMLSLQTLGARLRVKDGLFEVRVTDISGSGQEIVQHYAAHTIRTILMHQRTSISSDAMLLANRHQVQIIVLDEFQFPSSYMANLQKPHNIFIWKSQILLHQTVEGLDYARKWISVKIKRQLDLIAKLKGYRKGDSLEIINSTENFLKDSFTRISNFEIKDFLQGASNLRGMEGSAQRQYLKLLSNLMPDHLRFSGRSQQPAGDVFNAALNYGYGILYNWVETALWENGLNPYFGFMHNCDRHQKSLLFDFIEQYRPWIDKLIFNLCVRKELSKQHIVERREGGYWLNKEGVTLVSEAVYHRFLHKKVLVNGKKWNLCQLIQRDANQLAMTIVKGEKSNTLFN